MEPIHEQIRFLAGTAAFYQKQMPVGGPLQYETKEQYRERIVAWIDEILYTNNKFLQT